MNCPICRDRGFVIDSNKVQKKCVCQIKKELEKFLAPVLQYQLVKNTDFSKYNTQLVITKGTEQGFYSLVKSFLFKYYFEHSQNPREQYALATGISVMEDYLANTETKHTYLYKIPLMFLDVTKYYSNKVMGEVILYVLKQRQIKGLPFWVYTGSLNKIELEQIYNQALADYLNDSQKLNIDNYSKNLIQD